MLPSLIKTTSSAVVCDNCETSRVLKAEVDRGKIFWKLCQGGTEVAQDGTEVAQDGSRIYQERSGPMLVEEHGRLRHAACLW